MWTLENKLTELHKELPEESRIEPPNQPQLNLVKEFPERQFQVSFETHYRTYSKISITKLSYLIYRLNKTVMSMISHLYIIDWSYLKKTIYLNMGYIFKALRKIKQDKNYSICKGTLKQLLIDLARMVHRDHWGQWKTLESTWTV